MCLQCEIVTYSKHCFDVICEVIMVVYRKRRKTGRNRRHEKGQTFDLQLAANCDAEPQVSQSIIPH